MSGSGAAENGKNSPRPPAGQPDGTAGIPNADAPGARVGPYKLLQQIGEGGCGVVFLAEQLEPVRRQVALKIIKLGMDTRRVIARFEAERQALALMDHPNIARVLDAGATSTGRPYFVMELVRGTRLTTYCQENDLSLRQRLELFIQVCHAVQHAHQKGIIHRDLKPSNILVTLHDGVTPVPKVIDFGIAKATTDVVLTDKTLFTQFDALVGTPAYMSPEQANLNSADVDTRSDLYSLGVLLYELLTGVPPFDAMTLASSGFDEMRRTIREVDPIRPSTRVLRAKAEAATAAKATATAGGAAKASVPARVRIPEDLDWIVLQALEKDRTRRYQTANALAGDLQRYLDDEPVSARPPGKWYRLSKALRRHRVGVAAGLAIFGSLVLGLGVAVSQYWAQHAAHARAVAAEREQHRLRQEAEARAYAADLQLAQAALSRNHLGRARELLMGLRPRAGETDLRGWEWRYLWRQCESEALGELPESRSSICALDASPDGRWLALAEHGLGRIQLCDLTTRRLGAPIAFNPFNAVVGFDPQGRWLAFSTELVTPQGRQYGLSLWDPKRAQSVRALPLEERCQGLAFAADGERLLTATSGTKANLTVWRLLDGARLSQLSVEAFGPTIGTPFAATRDLRYVAQARPGGRLAVLDLVSGQVRWERSLTDGAVDAVAFSADGRLVAAGVRDARPVIRLLAADSGKDLGLLVGHTGYAVALRFSSDGHTLFSAGSDQTIRLWNVERRELRRTLRGHRLEVWRLALSSDEQTLYSGAKDGSIQIWEVRESGQPRERIRIPEPVWFGWRFTPDSRAVVGVQEAGQVRRWELPRVREARTLLELGPERVDGLISEDGRQVAASDKRGWVQVWDLKSGERRIEFAAGAPPVYLWSFSRDGNSLVVQPGDQSGYTQWNLNTGQMMDSPLRNEPWRIVGSFPQGRLHLRTGWRSPVPGATDGPRVRPEGLDPAALDAAFAPDGHRLAFGHHSGSVHLLDASTRSPLGTLGGFLQAVHSVAFSPDGSRLAAGGDGVETIKIWDVHTQHELITLAGDGVSSFITAFSPDGRWLGALSAAGNLELWYAPGWNDLAADTESNPDSAPTRLESGAPAVKSP